MKYVVATLSFLFSLVGVAVICGIAMVLIFQPKQHQILVGIETTWYNLPGTILGILAGIHAWRVSIRSANARKERKDKQTEQSIRG